MRRVWNTLLALEHPHGTTTFAGCQVRYLIGSAHGWMGAVGFSASALRLRARDAWMGWSDEQRKAHLHRVVCLSRFLIRPAVRCRHLAGHVLGRVLRRVGEDFEARYHYRPWLVETFVEPDRDGTSFKAANFVCVGHTAGRGRCDRHHARARTVKSVYMYELAAPSGGRMGRRGAVVGPRRGARQCAMGGERVRRSAVGRQAVVGASGHERRAVGVVSGPRAHRPCAPRPRGGEGLLPLDRPPGGFAGDAGAHRGATSRAHRAAHARARHGAVHPGRDGFELRDPPGLRGAEHHRAQSDRVEDAGPASVSDPGGERRGPAPGGAALRVR